MEKIKITNIEEFEDYRKKNIFINQHILFIQYLNVLYPNLVLRENDLSEAIESNIKSDILSHNTINNKSLIDKPISISTFNQYLGIQNLISERIFKYIDKSKKGKISKNDFCTGMYQIFFGNIAELTKLTFFICDFNEDGKIYKSDIKLILAYIPIPLNSNRSSQQEYIKEINKIIDEFFNEIKEEFKIDDNNIEEIKYNLYLTKITESINDNRINGAFFLFINLIKYIFINKPFNQETIDSVNYIKNKHLLKVSLPKSVTIKNINIFQKKPLVKSEFLEGGINNINNINNNNDINLFTVIRRKEKKFTDYKIFENNNVLGKIQQKDLFSIKKSSSVATINQKNKKKYENLKHDFIVAKNSENDNFKKLISELDSKNKRSNRNSSIGRLNSGKHLSYNQTIKKVNTANKIILKNKFNRNSMRSVGNSTNNSRIENKYINNNILPSLSSNIPLKKIIPNKLNIKIAPVIKLKYPKEPLQKENNILQNRNPNFLEDIKLNNNINSEKELGFYLYKYSEEEYHISLKKYYTVINKKELLFYSSNLKNELCSIWNLNDTIITVMRKASINKNIYYPIKIIYKNNIISYLLFEEKETQIEFGKQIKMNINNNNFEDKYEVKDKLGEGHFAVVKKCIEKNTGKEYAVKIITKQKLKKKDLDLIIHEKNYMKLIKNPNIVSLIDDFEDEKYIYLIMEYYKGGDLYSYINELRKNKKKLNEKSIAKIIKIIGQSIQYLNYFGVVHRDLKPENIVFGVKDDISSLTIIDLGVAITLSYGQMSNEPLGTLEYISPEIFTRKPYDHKVDVWSLGIILYILFTMGSVYPFDCDSKNKDEREKIIGKKIVFLQQEYPLEFFENKSKYLISLIDKSLEKSPDKRISIDEFLNNYWLINNSK